MFKYKTDKHRCLEKCKARLILCRNQQKRYELLTRARNLTIISLRILLVLLAKFDL